MPASVAPSRRDRLRAQTVAEIKQHAFDQIAEQGPEALSLVAIGRTMGMSGPALYRYFASREDLLAALVEEAWEDLAKTLEDTAAGNRRREPQARFRAVCGAYRAWALEQPHVYGLALQTRYGSGLFAPEATLPGAGRSMVVLVDAVADLGPLPRRRQGAIRALERQLRAWRESRLLRGDLPPAAFEFAVVAWARLHGTVGLELAGVLESMALDAALIHRAEVDQLLAQHAAWSGAATVA